MGIARSTYYRDPAQRLDDAELLVATNTPNASKLSQSPDLTPNEAHSHLPCSFDAICRISII